MPHFDYELLSRRRDAVWLRHRVVLEIDGYAGHQSQAAFHRDRREDQLLAAHGWLPLRATWPHLTREPEALMVRIGQALALRAAG